MLRDLIRNQRPLVTAGIVSLIGALLTAVLSLVDDAQILGISRWIKPAKFYFSVAIFLWTIVIYLYYLPNNKSFSRAISWVMIVVFVIEMAAITGQSIRGTTSHFNIEDPTNALIFGVMGIAIVINTLLVLIILIKYFRYPTSLPPAILWGMRLGLFLFLLGSLQGAFMSTQSGHTVGAADGGVGLPFTNWSTANGDLRVAHFLGLHSLQAVPIVALVLDRCKIKNATGLTVIFSLGYFAVFAALFIQAMLGRPFLRF